MSYDKIESNICALVLLILNLLNLLRKRNKRLDKPSTLCLFPNSFDISIKLENSCKIHYIFNLISAHLVLMGLF